LDDFVVFPLFDQLAHGSIMTHSQPFGNPDIACADLSYDLIYVCQASFLCETNFDRIPEFSEFKNRSALLLNNSGEL